jgi:choice-of-anchor B domain-containing protein
MKNLPLLALFLLFIQCTPESETPTLEPDTTDNVTSDTASTTNNSDTNTSHLSPTTFTPTHSCQNGRAGVYPCSGYDLFGVMSLADLSTSMINDVWGWTDPETKKEYVILGLSEGTAFIDISDPNAPNLLGKLPTHTQASTWRDVKVFNNHAFVVSEASNHGLQVFDLTRLRGITAPQQFTEDAHLDVFGSAHNIVINENSGYAYIVGVGGTIDGQNFSGGTLFININDPKNPEYVGSFSPNEYVHDAQVVRYEGPDTDYTGSEILFGSSSDGVSYFNLIIVDVTDKSQPKTISTSTYPFPAYTHQNWLTEDQSYVLLGDEGDESRYGFNTRTVIFDVKDLDAPELHFTYTAGTPSIDHNGYIKGDSFFLASYSSGLREINIADIANKQMQEIAFFDPSPTVENATFYGVWSIYPYFESGFIPISDSDNGLFLVRRSL